MTSKNKVFAASRAFLKTKDNTGRENVLTMQRGDIDMAWGPCRPAKHNRGVLIPRETKMKS